MSHFSVLVIGADVTAQLAPFHEFESTGVDDEYVKTVDITEEARAKYEKRDEEDLGKTFIDWVKGWYGYDEVSPADYPDTAKLHKHGYVRQYHDGAVKVFDRTNPNAKWDWYQVGGRWSGFLKLKTGAKGELGERSLLDNSPDTRAGYADVARKGDVDFAAMRDQAGVEAGDLWNYVQALTGGETWESWDAVRDRIGLANDGDDAREFYWNQPAVKKLKADPQKRFNWHVDDGLSGTREEYVAAARDNAVSTYAVVKDGEWFGQGEMGWFGMSRDELTAAEWNRKFNELIDSLPDDTLLTVVDCHI